MEKKPSVDKLLSEIIPFIEEDDKWKEVKLSVFVNRSKDKTLFDELLLKEIPVKNKDAPKTPFTFLSEEDVTIDRGFAGGVLNGIKCVMALKRNNHGKD
jgi:hypothetical protein